MMPPVLVVNGTRHKWADETHERDTGLDLVTWAVALEVAPGQPGALARVGCWLDAAGSPVAAAWCVDWRGQEYSRGDAVTLAVAVRQLGRQLEALGADAALEVVAA